MKTIKRSYLWVLSLLLVGLLLSFAIGKIGRLPTSCTIFTIAKGDTVLFGNNEDNDDARFGRIWFYPGRGDRHAVVLFGYEVDSNVFIPVGGMNNQGLILDMNGLPLTPIHHQAGFQDYSGSFFIRMLEETDSVQEVRQWVRSANLLLLETQQVHVADRTGEAVVLGLDPRGRLAITEKSSDFLVSSTFNLAHGEHADGTPCRRYDTATKMLAEMNTPTIEGMGEILSETAMTIHLYGYVVDLNSMQITLYSRGDFTHSATLDVLHELAQGQHSHHIGTLVSQQSGHGDPAATLLTLPFWALAGLLVLSGFFYTRRQGTRMIAVLITMLVFICLFVFAKLIRLPVWIVPIPNLVTVDLFLTLTPCLVYLAGILFRPALAGLVTMLGLVLAECAFCLVHGGCQELPAHVLFSLSSFGIAALIISAVRKKGTGLALVLGAVWMSLGFFLPASYYFSNIVKFSQYTQLYTLILTAINLLSIPIALLLLALLRRVFRVKYLDQLLLSSS